ncbi:hypothetical protein WA158_002134 [Blastocystis sp. Blastoise]
MIIVFILCCMGFIPHFTSLCSPINPVRYVLRTTESILWTLWDLFTFGSLTFFHSEKSGYMWNFSINEEIRVKLYRVDTLLYAYIDPKDDIYFNQQNQIVVYTPSLIDDYYPTPSSSSLPLFILIFIYIYKFMISKKLVFKKSGLMTLLSSLISPLQSLYISLTYYFSYILSSFLYPYFATILSISITLYILVFGIIQILYSLQFPFNLWTSPLLLYIYIYRYIPSIPTAHLFIYIALILLSNTIQTESPQDPFSFPFSVSFSPFSLPSLSLPPIHQYPVFFLFQILIFSILVYYSSFHIVNNTYKYIYSFVLSSLLAFILLDTYPYTSRLFSFLLYIPLYLVTTLYLYTTSHSLPIDISLYITIYLNKYTHQILSYFSLFLASFYIVVGLLNMNPIFHIEINITLFGQPFYVYLYTLYLSLCIVYIKQLLHSFFKEEEIQNNTKSKKQSNNNNNNIQDIEHNTVSMNNHNTINNVENVNSPITMYTPEISCDLDPIESLPHSPIPLFSNNNNINNNNINNNNISIESNEKYLDDCLISLNKLKYTEKEVQLNKNLHLNIYKPPSLHYIQPQLNTDISTIISQNEDSISSKQFSSQSSSSSINIHKNHGNIDSIPQFLRIPELYTSSIDIIHENSLSNIITLSNISSQTHDSTTNKIERISKYNEYDRQQRSRKNSIPQENLTIFDTPIESHKHKLIPVHKYKQSKDIHIYKRKDPEVNSIHSISQYTNSISTQQSINTPSSSNNNPINNNPINNNPINNNPINNNPINTSNNSLASHSSPSSTTLSSLPEESEYIITPIPTEKSSLLSSLSSLQHAIQENLQPKYTNEYSLIPTDVPYKTTIHSDQSSPLSSSPIYSHIHSQSFSINDNTLDNHTIDHEQSEYIVRPRLTNTTRSISQETQLESISTGINPNTLINTKESSIVNRNNKINNDKINNDNKINSNDNNISPVTPKSTTKSYLSKSLSSTSIKKKNDDIDIYSPLEYKQNNNIHMLTDDSNTIISLSSPKTNKIIVKRRKRESTMFDSDDDDEYSSLNMVPKKNINSTSQLLSENYWDL